MSQRVDAVRAGRGAFMLLTVISLVSVHTVVGKPSQKGTPLHHFQLSCHSCHEPASTNLDLEHQETNTIGQLRGNINQLCTSSGCHNYDAMLNHPVGIRPRGVIPTDMPLDSHLRITCLTCHDKTNSSEDTIHNSDHQSRLLYRPAGMQFCNKCHAKMGGTLLQQSHWRFSTRAHLSPINSQSPILRDYTQAIGGIDTESRTCLSCHDEVSVTIPADHETPQQRKLRWRNMSDHPIGMSYDRAALRRPGHYRYPLLDRQIRLFNDRVGCGSCHSPYVQTKNNLVAPQERGVMCRRCHIK